MSYELQETERLLEIMGTHAHFKYQKNIKMESPNAVIYEWNFYTQVLDKHKFKE